MIFCLISRCLDNNRIVNKPNHDNPKQKNSNKFPTIKLNEKNEFVMAILLEQIY